MEATTYGFGIEVPLDVDEAELAIRTALAEQGFGILTEIDVAATLKAKLDVERAAYRILGACNPPLAHRALQADEHIGLLLPCNVVVYAVEGGARIEAVDPRMMTTLAGDHLAPIAAEARERLARALQAVAEAGSK